MKTLRLLLVGLSIVLNGCVTAPASNVTVSVTTPYGGVVQSNTVTLTLLRQPVFNAGPLAYGKPTAYTYTNGSVTISNLIAGQWALGLASLNKVLILNIPPNDSNTWFYTQLIVSNIAYYSTMSSVFLNWTTALDAWAQVQPSSVIQNFQPLAELGNPMLSYAYYWNSYNSQNAAAQLSFRFPNGEVGNTNYPEMQFPANLGLGGGTNAVMNMYLSDDGDRNMFETVGITNSMGRYPRFAKLWFCWLPETTSPIGNGNNIFKISKDLSGNGNDYVEAYNDMVVDRDFLVGRNAFVGSLTTTAPVTNNGIVWFAVATNAAPNFAAPSGSICTTTNGQMFVRSNSVWILK